MAPKVEAGAVTSVHNAASYRVWDPCSFLVTSLECSSHEYAPNHSQKEFHSF